MLVQFLLLFHSMIVQTVKHQKPVAEKVWSVRCKTNDFVLNDCNWCWCGQDYHFKCKARVCEEVDVFGHFKDTISEIDVGMEGHGVWRSRPTSCTPGVQYQRGTVLCICDEDGYWPNPVCRDLFRILHSIEVTKNAEESTSQICTASKLYLVGCNVCFCPSSGKLDANLCTNRTCSDGDPVLKPTETDLNPKIDQEPKADEEIIDIDVEPSNQVDRESNSVVSDEYNIIDDTETKDEIVRKDKNELEIYAPCDTKKTYKIGREICECLANNRLVCNDDDKAARYTKLKKNKSQLKTSICIGKIGLVINIECNICKCTSKGSMYCTTKRCIPRSKGLSLAFKEVPKYGKTVKAPIDDLDCVPGTAYKRGCNTCYCELKDGKKIFGCTVKPCRKPTLFDITRDCVSGTKYETDCYICNCDMIDGDKHQVCKINPKCSSSLALKETRSERLDSLHGYCEPLHVYRKGCNTCRCLSNGKLVRCTTRPCMARSSEPVDVEVVPLQQAESERCPTGHSYKVYCNLCVCLSNGNALCTTTDCSTHRLIK